MLIDNQDQIINRFIQRIEQVDVIILSGHANTVTAIDICQQRNLLVSGSDDKTVKLWNLQNNSLIKTYQYSGLVNAVVFSNNANLLAFGGRGDYETQLVDISHVEKYNNIYELIGHTKDINKLAFSNNCKYLLSGSDDKTIRIWDCQSKKEKFKLNLGSSAIGIAIRADDALIVSNSKFGKVQIWNFLTQKLLCEMSTWMRGCEIQFSFNQKMLVSSSKFGDIKLWSLEQLDQRKLILIRKIHAGDGIYTVLFVPCSRYLISHCNLTSCFCQSSEIKIIDLLTCQVLKERKFVQEISYCTFNEATPIAITMNLQILAEGDYSQIRVLKMI